MRFAFDAVLFRWEARRDADWFFVSLPEDASGMIREIPRPTRGFGAVRVEVTAAGLTWRTSIFPSASEGVYILPVKRAVRDAAGAGDGDTLSVDLQVLEG